MLMGVSVHEHFVAHSIKSLKCVDWSAHVWRTQHMYIVDYLVVNWSNYCKWRDF